MSLVVVSNRIARPQPDVPIEGGLAAALLPIVESSGAIWVGAGDRLSESGAKDGLAKIVTLGAGAIVGIDDGQLAATGAAATVFQGHFHCDLL